MTISKKALQVCSALLFITFSGIGQEKKLSVVPDQRILLNVADVIQKNHYSPAKFDDEFSARLWEHFIAQLDPLKTLFLETDRQSLKKFRTLLDDEIRGEREMGFLPAVLVIYKQRLSDARLAYKKLMAVPLSFNTIELVNADGGNPGNFSANPSVLAEVRRKRFKFLVLQKMVASLPSGEMVPPGIEQEKIAREKVGLRMEKTISTMISDANMEKQFGVYLNSLTHLMDPHTTYLSATDAKKFRDKMSNLTAGIGAALAADDEGAKVMRLESSGEAAKAGVALYEIIVRMGEGQEGELKELAGLSSMEISNLIRGEKGSVLRIEVKKNSGEIKTYVLTRNQLDQSDLAVKAVVLPKGDKRIGYITFPLFYQDMNVMGAQVAADVAYAIEALKAQKVDAIIFDLRRNGGGSLQEVVRMVSLLIKEGPVVQVRERDGLPVPRSSIDMMLTFGTKPFVTQTYDGPLAVMVDEFSASASEIFASAIQDYRRGIVIGSTSTHGKGTVQRPYPIGDNAENGTLNLTWSQFYRVTGSSTQHKGVVPDIVLPDQYEFVKSREKDMPTSLPWDMVAPVSYEKWSGKLDIVRLQQRANERIEKDSALNLIARNTIALRDQQTQKISLSLEPYRASQLKLQKINDDNLRLAKLAGRELVVEPVLPLGQNQPWLKNIQQDIYIDQAISVVLDMLQNDK
ncbi:carboxyl-terminal processing protease [Pedobacter sp. ok626]|uniref:carboxy terminal-processing peptidase n=1 Tax=Pedobacter sp. ok626 TaxID=1761882 RepID=UPI0008926CED|nr:carboxy terminal-processing peptidase [Pedobacter sp. ok626]SDL68198.1 carboxyl-terminal processing protease [Pedobacter sp. ok626]